ncbi:hypothetical protein VNI00_002898 [Paramarasmius palmivorus]|uniref:G-patch domain-containing protein n=1 Tax=Paramarasmius palmivorus TaxID=297713 RepID=A0AAW0DU49_9AGAR
MGRRKRVIEDDDDSDSYEGSENDDDFGLNEDPDTREERALFENPYKRKRRRKNGKEQALYGIFADSDEEEGGSGRRGGKAGQSKRSDWTKAPAFVSGNDAAPPTEETMDLDDEAGEKDGSGSSEGEAEGEGEGAEDISDDESEPSRRPSPRIREEEDEEDEEETTRPQLGGIGSQSRGGIGSGLRASAGSATPSFSKGGIGSSRLASTIGETPQSNEPLLKTATTASGRGGIGSSSKNAESTDLPTSFGDASRSSSFVRDNKPARSATPLSHSEQLHFAKISGTFGARMLEKMGWKTGTGLGVTGEGIVTPVESKLRPERAGIAFRGFKEKTEQSKMEARRRGEVVSDDEDPMVNKARKKEREAREKRSDMWKKPKKVKTKVEHKTYEQIIAEAGGEPAATGVGQIIDATGAVPREVGSLAEVSLNNWTPSIDPTRIPEIRHNVRLIAEACKTDLDGLAREAKSLEERKRFVTQEDLRLRKKVDEEAELIARLQQVQLVASEIDSKAKEIGSLYEVSLEGFSPLFYKLMTEYEREFDKYRLDEVVVAAIAPLVRRMVSQWNPLENPTAFMSEFRNWRRALRVNMDQPPAENQVDIYGTSTVSVPPTEVEKPMTPFESLLWNVWLPKVRTAINNDWSPQVPHPAVKLYEVWSTFLPPFIRDNILDQLILPKVQKAVAQWNPKQDDISLQSIVFPWLPHVGLRLEDVLGDARRKVKSLLRQWVVGEDIPKDLKAWKEVFDPNDWDNIMLKYVVPKLGATLRNDFKVNPRNQSMEPIQQVLLWSDLLRPSFLSQLLETEFFPKWLDVLHVWLMQPKVSFEEVAQWYSFWKGAFPESLQNLRGFTRGLQLMNQAIELGPEAPSRLPRPDYRAEQASAAAATPSPAVRKPAQSSSLAQEITFRSIVEEYAATHNLMFMPAGRAHEKSRMPLYRISPSADGKGGVLVYILDDAVWASVEGAGGPTDEYRPISLENMVLRATGKVQA